MKVGFTGTQRGMTEKQKMEFARLILDLYPYPSEFHHGDCIGADAEAHKIIETLSFGNIEIQVHPSTNEAKRAFCVAFVIYKPQDYLSRNHGIVDATDLLIACPKGNKEQIRSGTWATVRYARRKKKQLRIIYP